MFMDSEGPSWIRKAHPGVWIGLFSISYAQTKKMFPVFAMQNNLHSTTRIIQPKVLNYAGSTIRRHLRLVTKDAVAELRVLWDGTRGGWWKHDGRSFRIQTGHGHLGDTELWSSYRGSCSRVCCHHSHPRLIETYFKLIPSHCVLLLNCAHICVPLWRQILLWIVTRVLPVSK